MTTLRDLQIALMEDILDEFPADPSDNVLVEDADGGGSHATLEEDDGTEPRAGGDDAMENCSVADEQGDSVVGLEPDEGFPGLKEGEDTVDLDLAGQVVEEVSEVKERDGGKEDKRYVACSTTTGSETYSPAPVPVTPASNNNPRKSLSTRKARGRTPIATIFNNKLSSAEEWL